MAFLAIASASGFRIRPAEMASTLLAIPGFCVRRVESEGRKLRGDASDLIEQGLRSENREVSFDFMGRSRDEWGYLWATKAKTGLPSEVDLLVVNWPGLLNDEAVAAFGALCESACAEFGCLDGSDPFPGFKWLWDIPLGLPGLAWAMWFGPQLAAFLPAGALEKCWPVAEHRQAGHLVMLDRSPPPYTARAREAVAACLGAEVFAPRRERWPLDTSSKNTIVPDWVREGRMPDLPPEMRIIGIIPGKSEPSKK